MNRTLCHNFKADSDLLQITMIFVKFVMIVTGIAFVLWVVTPGKIKLKGGAQLVFIFTPTVVDNVVYYWGWIHRKEVVYYLERAWCYTPINGERFTRYLSKAI